MTIYGIPLERTPVLATERAPRSTISLPLPLIERIRELAQHRGLNIADLLADWVNQESAALGLTSSPWIEIIYSIGPSESVIQADITGLPRLNLSAGTAISLADTIEKMATESGSKPVADLDADVWLARVGASVKLTRTVPTKNPRKGRDVSTTIPFGAAKEVARELRKAAAEAPTHAA